MASVNKNDLAQQIAEATDLSTGQAKAAVEKTLEILTARLAAGDEVSLAGFGKFTAVPRAAREGKNPSTGETIQIAATTVPKFSAASALKAAVKG
jgi:nucleoid DNA-binding protein